ncbi:MAG: NADP-binding protein [Caldiserica bacterium]|nr:MAG: NADP-binding protein [Caldisericota bacterium]
MYKLVFFGLGTIGREILKTALLKRSFKIAGGVDVNPDIIGKDLGELIGEEKLGVNVVDSIKKIEEADVVVHSTSSFLKTTLPQFKEIMEAGFSVISTCEELFYPFHFHKKEAEMLDKIAKENGVSILGAGINPGFVLDTLVSFITTVSRDIEKITAERYLDASKRRKQLQLKVGASLSKEEFDTLKKDGKLGHIGLPESLTYIFDSLGWKIKDIENSLEPVIAEEDFETEYLKIKKGSVRGQHQVAKGISEDGREIKLILRMAVGEKESFDRIRIKGIPDIDLKIDGGVHGDIGTSTVIINYIPGLMKLPPGLHSTRDLPLPHFTM